MDVASPFTIPAEQIKAVENDDDIRTVGAFLKKQNYKYCRAHSCLPVEVQSIFTLHRDILHTVLLPVLQIHRQAAQYASSLLAHYQQHSSGRPTADLEVAFRGPARSAFSWIQCFVSQEQDWALTKGCPACIVLKTLHDEPFIRIVVAACSISSYLYNLLQCRGEPVQMPDFSFWLKAVREAVVEDPFWGQHFWSEIEARAISLSSGIQELVSHYLLSSTKMAGQPAAPTRGVGDSAPLAWAQGVENGGLVKREMKLKQEEQQWIKILMEACCSTLLTEAARRRKLVSARRWQEQGRSKATRQRSLTT